MTSRVATDIVLGELFASTALPKPAFGGYPELPDVFDKSDLSWMAHLISNEVENPFRTEPDTGRENRHV